MMLAAKPHFVSHTGSIASSSSLASSQGCELISSKVGLSLGSTDNINSSKGFKPFVILCSWYTQNLFQFFVSIKLSSEQHSKRCPFSFRTIFGVS